MQNNSLYGFRILETIRNERSIQTYKIKLNNGKICIAKTFHQSFCIKANEQMTFMINLNTIFGLKYPSLLPFDGYNLRNYETLLYPIIFTQHLPNGSLENLLNKIRQRRNRFKWTPTDNYITLLGISLGLNFLHSKNIVHQYLKTSNILFDDNYRPVICDIDIFNQTPTTFIKSYDICCFAQIMYELITNKPTPIKVYEIPDLKVQEFIINCTFIDDIEKVPSSEKVLDFILKKHFINLFGTIDMNKVIEYLNFFHQNQTDGEDFYAHGMLLYEENEENAIDIFKEGAKRGSAKCAFMYASMVTNEEVNIVDYDKDEIIQLYEKAIEKGNVISMYKCACYITQNFQSKEYIDKANDYYRMAAEKGHVLASYQYALILLDLNKKKEAAHFFKEAADKENVESMFYYANLLMKGDGIDKNKDEAMNYYKKAIDKGDIKSMNNYAKIIMNNNNDDDKKLAAKYFQIAAEKGNDCAMCNYAYMLQVGQGIEQNMEEAKKYYSESIKKGNPKAMNFYGRMLELYSFNDDENIAKAGYLYKTAAEKGNVKAMNNLISFINKGKKIEISTDDMIQYCKIAAVKGKVNSMAFYARMLYTGKNVTMNKDNAESYFRKAIEKGSIDAMFHYGQYLELENNVDCIYYYKLAAEKGNTQVNNHLMKIIKKFKNELNDMERIYYYKFSANNGNNAYAMYKYGSMLSKKKEWIEAAKYFWKSINAFQNNESLTDETKIFYEKALNSYMDILEKQKIEPMSQFQEENTEIFKKALDLKNLYAMVQYGLRLKDGIGTDIDEDKAFYYIKKAADSGYLLGIQNYARFLELGIGIEKNLEEAKKFYKIAIENGSINSIIYYSLLVNNHFPDSIDEALNYLKEAAKKGYNEAMYIYASKFVKDQEEKLSYFKKAAENGYYKAMYNYALLLYKENAFDKIQDMKKYFYKALTRGHIKSMRYYAETLKNDQEPNMKLIGFYYKKSADNGDKKSMYLYGKFLEKNDNIFHDSKTSIHYIKLAADHGHKKAMKEIIEMILANKFTPENKDELVFYLKKGIENHNLKAMHKYGCMLKDGDGNQTDYEKGIEYIKNAADEGYIDAMSDYISDNLSKKGIVNYNFDHFEEESRKYQQILLDYKSDNMKVFIDENFPPFKNWKRIDEIYPAPLFKKELIGPDYIVQGEIGDCYLMSSLSRIAKQHYLVYPLFERYLPNLILGPVDDSINIKCGAVVIYFQAFGHRTPVLIDTFIPIKDGIPLLSSLSDDTKSPWFCLVEKAFAKLCGSFSNIVSGMASNVIYYLFFYYSKIIHNSYLTRKSTAFQNIMKYQEKGYLIEASIANNSTDTDGLIKNHSYFLFKAREVQDQKFICLRNPWGTSSFKGKYERNSPNWTPELKKLLGFDQCQSGTFFMTEDEFFKYFDSIVIIKPVRPEWYVKRYQCQLTPGPFDGVEIENQNADLSNHQTFAFQITENFQIGKKCHLRIIVERSKSTFYDQINNNQERSKYCLIIGHINGQKFDADINSTSDYQCYEGALNIQTFSIEVTNNDIITIVLHRLDKHEYTENCYVSVICDYRFKLYDVDFPSQEIPNSENPGIVFDNFTISFPNISKPLTMTYWDNRFVLTFGSLTLNDHIKQNEFEKLFEFANKNVESSYLHLNDFKPVSKAIGQGSSAKIYIVEEKKTKIRYAAKIGNRTIKANIGFLRELTILRSIKYPSIINFKGFIDKDFIDEQYSTIITEYLPMDSLSKMLQREHLGILDSKELKKYNLRQKWTPVKKMINLIGIALGMDYLHRHNIIHRDLKFQNVLLDDDLYPKICDFGDSKFIDIESDKLKTQFVGTFLFMAPEISNGSKTYSFPVDVYSFGVMAYFIYSNQFPSNSNCSISFEYLDEKYHKFISDMINPDPNKRPTFSQIVDSFLTNKNETWIDGVLKKENEKENLKEIEFYLHKFGLSLYPKEPKIDFDIIKTINEEMYPENAKHPKIELQQIIENDSIPKEIKDCILTSESYINTNSHENNNEEEIGQILFEVGQLFYLGNKESIFNIQEDHFYAIKYLKEAALCKNEQSICLLAYIFATDSKPESREYAFKIASFAADLDNVNGFYNLGIFYSYGVGVKSNVVMSAINFKIAADKGDVSSMIEYANTLMKVGEHEFDLDELKEQIKEAEKIIFQDEGKKNYIYNETRLTIDALENEYVALYVSEKYFQKAMKKGNKEAEQKYLLIKKNNKNYSNHPQYYDDLFLSLHT